MRRTCTILVAVVALSLVSCRRQDARTVSIHVPGMKNEACVEHVHTSLRRVPGVQVDSIVIDDATRTVLVTYESLNLSLKNIEFAIADAGFDANQVPANAEAVKKLPASCR